MRTLKLQVQTTIDGYIAGPNGEQDWVTSNWDSELEAYVEAITEPVDCIVLGRKLAEGFIPYWASVAENPADPQFEAGKKFTNTRKVVFARTLDESRWENTVLAKGDLADEITKLKKQDGGDIIAYGGADFVSNLIKRELVDAFHVFINPVAIGCGMAIFEKSDDKQNMTLMNARSFECGIVALHYEPKRRHA